MFSKSILRALAIDGGVGLENPTRLVNLLEEFSQKIGSVQLIRNVAGGTSVLAVVAGLSGAVSMPLLIGVLCAGGSLGSALRHRLSANDERELALLQRHRSLLHALSEIEKLHGTEQTLARYEELITTYSQIDDCFYFGQARIEAGDITNLMTQAIATSAPSLRGSVPPAASKRFCLAEMAKPTSTITTPETPALPATPIATSLPVSSPPPQNWDADVPLEEVAIAPQNWDADKDDSARWMQDLLHYPAVLIYGAQGSGKTTLVTWLIHQRQQIGHQVEILDPHREYGQWEGFSVYGDGLDYGAIDERLVGYSKLVVSRYQQRAQQPTFNPRPLTYLVEEFTQWHRKCRYSSAFFESSLSDTRKINMGVIFVSHGRTLVTLGGAKGLAETRDHSLLEVELFAQVDPATKKASPTGKGRIK